MTNEERKEKFEQYRKEHLKRVPLDMQKKDYERLKAHAHMRGVPINRYIKEAVTTRMDKEDRRDGIDPEAGIRVNESGEVEFYRWYDK